MVELAIFPVMSRLPRNLMSLAQMMGWWLGSSLVQLSNITDLSLVNIRHQIYTLLPTFQGK